LASPPEVPYQSNGEEVENLDDAEDAAAHEEARCTPEGHCQHSTTVRNITCQIQLGYLAAVPPGLGDAATDAVIAHSGRTFPPAQSPSVLTVVTYRTCCLELGLYN
jgi:hypothetical protein